MNQVMPCIGYGPHGGILDTGGHHISILVSNCGYIMVPFGLIWARALGPISAQMGPCTLSNHNWIRIWIYRVCDGLPYRAKKGGVTSLPKGVVRNEAAMTITMRLREMGWDLRAHVYSASGCICSASERLEAKSAALISS